ncbi:MAG TPA: cupin domain-containing protein [Chloroflexota bacterium]|nr:cupin domain-containing protein [Chloroflexota bacterium]
MAIETIEELDGWLAERHLNGHWRGMARMPTMEPYLWKWSDIYHGLTTACDVVPMEDTGRRTIQLRNPSLGDRMSNTIHMSVQCVMPGEIATAHRHNAAAVRFVVQGTPGAFTVVEGEAIPMDSGDLITTPNWTWHDHYNEGDKPVIWLDGLDIRMISMAKMFQEPFSQDRQPIVKPTGFTANTLTHMRPAWLKHEHRTPPFRYPWNDTVATLESLRSAEVEDPCDGIHLSYSHPVTGGPTLPTFGCDIQLFRPRWSGKPHRHNSTTIYQVFRGAGVTVVEDQRLEWEQGDIFVIPPWNWHHHENASEDSILFSMTDRPAMEALEVYREEVEAA